MDLKYLGNITILLVEDDIFNLQLIRSLLKKISHANIISTDDGSKALDTMESGEQKIDMILLDLHLPQMSGKEILHHIRKNKDFDDLPVLIISVDGMDETELRQMGANDFILKPFDIDDLAKKISIHSRYNKAK